MKRVHKLLRFLNHSLVELLENNKCCGHQSKHHKACPQTLIEGVEASHESNLIDWVSLQMNTREVTNYINF